MKMKASDWFSGGVMFSTGDGHGWAHMSRENFAKMLKEGTRFMRLPLRCSVCGNSFKKMPKGRCNEVGKAVYEKHFVSIVESPGGRP